MEDDPLAPWFMKEWKKGVQMRDILDNAELANDEEMSRFTDMNPPLHCVHGWGWTVTQEETPLSSREQLAMLLPDLFPDAEEGAALRGYCHSMLNDIAF